MTRKVKQHNFVQVCTWVTNNTKGCFRNSPEISLIKGRLTVIILLEHEGGIGQTNFVEIFRIPHQSILLRLFQCFYIPYSYTNRYDADNRIYNDLSNYEY